MIVANAESLPLLRAERDENTCRKHFTLEESVAIAAKIEPLEQKEAKQRQKEHGNTAPGRKNTSGNLPEVSESRSARESSGKTAAAVGMSRHTLERAKQVVKAAEAEHAKYRPLVDEMLTAG